MVRGKEEAEIREWDLRKEMRGWAMGIANKVVAIMDTILAPVAAPFRSDALLARAFRPLINRIVPIGPTWIVVRSGAAQGLHLLIYPRSEKYYWTGAHEVSVQQSISSILKPSMTFWDIGAHIGFFTLLASRLVGVSGHVHSFEPMAQNRERLLASIKMNACKNTSVHDCALAATSGEAVLHAHESSLMWTLVPELGKQEGLAVRCCTLDEATEFATPPDLIKVDAEGAEVDVLRGGLNFLATARPSLIVEFSNGTLLAEARGLLPFYTFKRLALHHWLLRQ